MIADQMCRSQSLHVSRRLAEPRPHFTSHGAPAHAAGDDDIAAMRAELAKVTSMLDQLRAGAQLERSAHAARANALVSMRSSLIILSFP